MDRWLYICELLYMDVVFRFSAFVSFHNIACMLACQIPLENGLYKVKLKVILLMSFLKMNIQNSKSCLFSIPHTDFMLSSCLHEYLRPKNLK